MRRFRSKGYRTNGACTRSRFERGGVRESARGEQAREDEPEAGIAARGERCASRSEGRSELLRRALQRSAAHRKPMFPVQLSGVLLLRAATR
jgi:hypothetical protein